MADKIAFESEKLDMDALDSVVAGASLADVMASVKKQTTVFVADTLHATEAASTAASPPRAVSPGAAAVAPDLALQDATLALNTSIAKLATQSPDEAKKALGTFVSDTTSRIKAAYPAVDVETAASMAWSSAYKAVYEGGSIAGKAPGIVDALKTSITQHASDISRGLAAEVGITGDLKGSLTRTSDMLAQSIKGVSVAAADEIKSKAAAAYEFGLSKAMNDGTVKAMLAALDDPKNAQGWATVMANVAYGQVTGKAVTVVGFLAEAMTSQATAKAIGLGDFPAQVKQTAQAVVNALEGVKGAFVDIYSGGVLAGFTMGLDVKGIVNIGKNCADLGQAMVKGDVDGMKNAAQELVTDMMYDVRDGLKKYYVDSPVKAFNWTKDVAVNLMDDLGATPYINLGAKATADAFADFGNMAKNGSMNAMNVLEDFARNEVTGALGTLEGLAKSGVNGAAAALEDVAKAGVRGAVAALGEVLKIPGAGQAIDAMANLIKANVPGAMDTVVKAATQVEAATWTLRKAAEEGSAAALNEVSNLAKTASGNFQRICVDGVQQAIVRGVPGAVDKMADLIQNDTKWARDSAQWLIGQGGKQAQQLLDKCETLYGTAAGATAVVEWAAKYAINDVGRSAIGELQGIASKSGAYAGQAIDALANVMRLGGERGDRAWDAVASVAESAGANASKAIGTMTEFTRAGAIYASQSLDSLSRVARSGSNYANQAIDGLASVASKSGAYANQAIDSLASVMRVGSAQGNRAWDAVSGIAESAGANASKAIGTMTDLTRNGAAYASQSLDSLNRVAKAGGGYANQAVDGLASVARSGGAYVNQAVDALKGLSGQADMAKKALENLANDGIGAAKSAWNEITRSKINPSNW